MKLLGLLIIVNAIVVTGYWVLGEHPNKSWAMTIGILSIFVGLIFTLHERVLEITIKGVGTIKAATQQATIDAKTVSELKGRVEAQSATVDLVAQHAMEARKITSEVEEKSSKIEEKVRELNKLTSEAADKLLDLENITEFSKVAIAAQNDDRFAFDQLGAWGEDKTFGLWEQAANIFTTIRTHYGGPIAPGCRRIEWPKGVDPQKLSLEHIKANYRASLAMYHTDLVRLIDKNTTVSRKEKMQLYIDILAKDASLGATFYAGKYFLKEANDPGLKWSPFYTTPLLDWWLQNRK